MMVVEFNSKVLEEVESFQYIEANVIMIIDGIGCEQLGKKGCKLLVIRGYKE